MTPTGHGWEIAWDQRSGKQFYQNRKLGVSQYDRPTGVDLPAREKLRAPLARELLAETLAQGWESAWDATYQRVYYYNRATQERTWDRDAAVAAPVQPPRRAMPTSDEHGGPLSLGRVGVQPRGSGVAGEASASRAATGRHASAGSRAFERWDAEGFKEQWAKARAGPDFRSQSRELLRKVSEHNYVIRDAFRPERTRLVPHRLCDESWRELVQRHCLGQDPEVSFSYLTTADAVLRLRAPAESGGHGSKVCILNFANGSQVGGGYKSGATAQEEDLCRRFPGLYTTLYRAAHAERPEDSSYPFGPSTLSSSSDPAESKYSDVLWAPSVCMGRLGPECGFALLPEEAQVRVSVVSAAAPNLRFASPPERSDEGLVYNTVKSIFIAPKLMDPGVTTLILGAWGCGAFGGNPAEISGLFARALTEDRERLARLYQHVHFAIPRAGADRRAEEDNASVFLRELRRHGIKIRELH